MIIIYFFIVVSPYGFWHGHSGGRAIAMNRLISSCDLCAVYEKT